MFFLHSYLVLAEVGLHFCSLLPGSLERKNKRDFFIFASFNLCSNLEISPMVLETTPYKCVLRRFKEVGGVVLEGEALSHHLS